MPLNYLYNRVVVTPALARRGQLIHIPKPVRTTTVYVPQNGQSEAGRGLVPAVQAVPLRAAAAVASPAAVSQGGAGVRPVPAQAPARARTAVPEARQDVPLSARLVAQQHYNSPAVVVSRPRLPASKRDRVRKGGPVYLTPDASPGDLERIRNLRGLGHQRLLVIVANGPSLAEIDPTPLKRETNIDILSINKPDSRLWPTRYWAFFDQSQLSRHRDLWYGYDGYLFNSTSIQQRRPGTIQFKNIHDMGFSLDLLAGLYIGRSSVYAAMQIGLWLDYDHIYIVGCDMCEVDGKLHFYGRNPDVDPAIRKSRFDQEASYYDSAAKTLAEELRRRFTFCSAYNPYPFVEKYGRLDHKIAIAEIVATAHGLLAQSKEN